MDNNYKMKIHHLFQFYMNKITSDFRNDVIPRFNTLQDYNGFLRAINEFMDREIKIGTPRLTLQFAQHYPCFENKTSKIPENLLN